MPAVWLCPPRHACWLHPALPPALTRRLHACHLRRLKTISSYTAFSRLVLILRALHVNMDKVSGCLHSSGGWLGGSTHTAVG